MWAVFQISSTDRQRFEEREKRVEADQDYVLRVLKENIERSMQRRPVGYRADPNATQAAIARATLRFINNSEEIGEWNQGETLPNCCVGRVFPRRPRGTRLGRLQARGRLRRALRQFPSDKAALRGLGSFR